MNNLIHYQQLDNGIHEITFLAKTRASVDEFFQTVQPIYEAVPSKQTMRILVDLSTAGTIPMQYMFQEGQRWRRRNPSNLPVRVLILYPARGILPVARVLVNSVAQSRGIRTKLRLESVVNRDEAIEWLLQDAP
jgi:hypothetical protein